MPTTYDEIAGRSVARVAGLSDALFGVAMTLIVLEIRAPAHVMIHDEMGLVAALMALVPRMVTYLMSFLTLGIFWVGQGAQLEQLDHLDRRLTWLQLAFLASVALLPFSTALLAEFITYRTALLVYWSNLLLLGLVALGGWEHAKRASLLKPGERSGAARAIERRLWGGQILYAIGAALCIFSTYLSIVFIVAVQLSFAVAPSVHVFEKLQRWRPATDG